MPRNLFTHFLPPFQGAESMKLTVSEEFAVVGAVPPSGGSLLLVSPCAEGVADGDTSCVPGVRGVAVGLDGLNYCSLADAGTLVLRIPPVHAGIVLVTASSTPPAYSMEPNF